jgi:hypothetical protein
MRIIVTGMAILALGVSVTACNRAEPEANVDVAADLNADMPMDGNMAMDNMAMDNMATDTNAVDANAANATDATENVTEQGSTDH